MNSTWLYLVPALYWAPLAAADYKTDIGYAELQTLLGAKLPNGAGVNVVHAEASTVGLSHSDYPIYAPDTANAQFAGKTFNFPGTRSTAVSAHANAVGSRFYGKDSMANGINHIASYDADEWLMALKTDSVSPPINGSRIANHSWIGEGGTDAKSIAEVGNLLRLLDRQVQHTEFIQVAAMHNGLSNAPLLGSAYNAIAVGRSDGLQDRGSDPVDAVYAAGRVRPDLVTPQSSTSAATPLVAAAAALLVETGHKRADNLSNGAIEIDGVGTVYNAERAETVKAALMAGADRVTHNTSTTDNIVDYRSSAHQTSNGLDDRYGAGQLNILRSYEIIAAGEQDSLEDGGSLDIIPLAGFDYDASFGGLASNDLATYKFSALSDLSLTATLVWNIDVSNDAALTTTLFDLNLELFDTTAQSLAGASRSSVDNTENLWLNLVMGHSYELRVKSAQANAFAWDYALAWHTDTVQAAPVPLPGAYYLFFSAISAMAWLTRRKAYRLARA